jgi:hypothetical protein
MSQLVVELHVPLVPASDLPAGSYAYPWILKMDEGEIELGDGVEEYDSGEESGEYYVFLLTGADEDVVVAAAGRLAARPEFPSGAFAIVSDEEAEEFGIGRRVDFPARP